MKLVVTEQHFVNGKNRKIPFFRFCKSLLIVYHDDCRKVKAKFYALLLMFVKFCKIKEAVVKRENTNGLFLNTPKQV